MIRAPGHPQVGVLQDKVGEDLVDVVADGLAQAGPEHRVEEGDLAEDEERGKAPDLAAARGGSEPVNPRSHGCCESDGASYRPGVPVARGPPDGRARGMKSATSRATASQVRPSIELRAACPSSSRR